MWDLILSVPDHCLSFYLAGERLVSFRIELNMLALFQFL